MRRGTGWRRWAAVVGFCAAMLSSVAAEATVAVPLSRAEQVQLSDLVVRVTVLSHASGWNADHSHIVTLTRLRVHEVYKGPASPGGELVLRQFGGEADGLVERVPGDPQLADGQDVVVFLRSGPGVMFLTAMAQSVYYVSAPVTTTGPNSPTATGGVSLPTTSLSVRRDLDGITFARPRPNGPMEIYEPTVEPPEALHRLRDTVRAFAAGGAR